MTKVTIHLLSTLEEIVVDVNDIRAKCDHCGMYQRPDWTRLLVKKQAKYCEYCTYPSNNVIFFYQYKPIKINCNWCNPKGKKITKNETIKDFVILGE